MYFRIKKSSIICILIIIVRINTYTVLIKNYNRYAVLISWLQKGNLLGNDKYN